MANNTHESSWHRASTDAEKFRKDSKLWFWGVEIVGAASFGLIGSLIGGNITPSDASKFWQNAYPGIGGAIGVISGFLLAFMGIFVWNLFRAPYRQRNEAYIEIAKLERLASETEKDMGDYFPRLNLIRLKEFAKRVTNRHKDLPIIKITLYRFTTFIPNYPQKYAIVSEVDSKIKLSSTFEVDIDQLRFISGFLDTNSLGIDTSFEEVYKERPKDNFIKEWVFLPHISDDSMPAGVMTEEKNIILYQSNV